MTEHEIDGAYAAAVAEIRELDLTQAPGSETPLLGPALDDLSCDRDMDELFDLHGTLVWWRAAYRAQRYGVDVDEILTGGHEIEGLRRLVAEARGLAEEA